MKSEVRGFVVSFIIFSLWGTIIIGPFRYFAYVFRDLFIFVFDYVGISSLLSGWIISLMLMGIVLLLLSFGTRKYASYTAGVCALLSLSYYLFNCIIERNFTIVSLTVVAGMALALAFLVFRIDRGSLWLADSYIFSIVVLLFLELVITPLAVLLPDTRSFALRVWMIDVNMMLSTSATNESLGIRIGTLFRLPSLFWGVTLFLLITVPVFILSKNRKKG